MAKKTTPTVVQSSAPPATQDDLMDRMAEDAGLGRENIGVDDLLIPRLTILQGLSPQVIPSKPEYQPDAKQGDIYDVTMRENFGSEVQLLICYYVRVWNEWFPRGSGRSGIVQRHMSPRILDNTRPGENNQPTLANGNTITETAEFYAMNMSAGGRKSFLPMAVTQLKEAKRINNYISTEQAVHPRTGQLVDVPSWYRVYNFTTVPTSNAKGTWYLWKAERGPLLSTLKNAGDLYEQAKRFRAAIVAGEARGDMSDEGDRSISTSRDDVPWAENSGQRRNAGPL